MGGEFEVRFVWRRGRDGEARDIQEGRWGSFTDTGWVGEEETYVLFFTTLS